MMIKFKLDKESVIKICSTSMVQTKTFNRTKLCIYIYLFCLVGLVFVLSDDKNMRIYSVIIGVVGSAFIKQYAKIIYKYVFSKKYNKEGYSYMFKEMTICIEEENIHIINSMGERIIKFSSINSLNVIEKHLFIFLLNKEYILIPISTFKFPYEKEDFINLLEKKVDLKVTNSYPEILSYK